MKITNDVAETKSETKTASSAPPRHPPYIAGGFDDGPPRNFGPNRPEFGESQPPIVWLLRFVGFFLFAVAWGGHFLLLRTWPGSLKLTVCTTIGVLALVHSLFVPSKRLARKRRSFDMSLSFTEVLAVIGIMLVAGVFMTWLTIGVPLQQ